MERMPIWQVAIRRLEMPIQRFLIIFVGGAGFAGLVAALSIIFLTGGLGDGARGFEASEQKIAVTRNEKVACGPNQWRRSRWEDAAPRGCAVGAGAQFSRAERGSCSDPGDAREEARSPWTTPWR